MTQRTSTPDEALDDIANTSDGELMPTLDELQEISDDPSVDFEDSDAPEDDDDRAGVL